MLTQIQALNYRCLHYIDQPLEPFHILVGPNATGKTTFMDIISFLSKLISEGLDAAISERTNNFYDLVWQRSGKRFELAIEAQLPTNIQKMFVEQNQSFDRIRYEVAIGIDPETDRISILDEKALLKNFRSQTHKIEERTLFPMLPDVVGTLISKNAPRKSRDTRQIAWKVPHGNDYFASEFLQEGKVTPWQYAFKLGAQKSALGNLPSDETKFQATNWLKNFLAEGVQPFILNSLLIRKASPPSQGKGFKPDGSNLPWVIEDLRTKAPERFNDWITHLQTALPDIEGIRTIEREDDRHRYLVIKYKDGLEVPSWMVSDGTLRLLALTLPAYLTDLKGIYLIEEPENGIHPRAVDCVFQSLSSVYNAQILLASHSPVLLGIAKIENILCFAKIDGATDIVAGDLHPVLKEWKGDTNLGDLFAAGVLG